MTTPINELVGEISKRPDAFRVKAYDDDSKSEELEFKTQLLQDYVVSQAQKKILEKAAFDGVDITDDELQEKTLEQVKDELDNYTSVAEKWANHILTAEKAEFVLKEKSEDAFRDLLISSREFFLLGYNRDATVTITQTEPLPLRLLGLSLEVGA